MPKGVKGFQKGNPGKPVGALNKETLNKLERRAVFEKEVNDIFIETIRKARPEYLLDQFLGKAEEILNLKVKESPSDRIKALAELLKHAKDTNPDK